MIVKKKVNLFKSFNNNHIFYGVIFILVALAFVLGNAIYNQNDNSEEVQKNVDADCRSAAIGCGDCKNILCETMLEGLNSHMERRKDIVSKPQEVYEILEEGSQKAGKIAQKTLDKAREAMNF